jgi:hypothetical protein
MRQIRLTSENDAAAKKCASRAIKMALFMPSRATRRNGAGGFEQENASAAHRIGSKRRQRVEMAINPSLRAARLMPSAFADAMAPADSGKGARGTAPASGDAVPFSLWRPLVRPSSVESGSLLHIRAEDKSRAMEDRYR